MTDITLSGAVPCQCGGRQVIRLEREREGQVVERRYVLACWNGHRSYVA